MRVGLAYDLFYGAFKQFFPELEIVDKNVRYTEYDLIIFSGGEDIDPGLYGQKNTFSSCNPERDSTEVSIFQSIDHYRMCGDKAPAVLGVCRGHQLICALRGSPLIQHLDDVGINHNEDSLHPLKFYDDTLKPFFSGGVNSLHHQGVSIKQFKSKGLSVTSSYLDIVESTSGNGILTVQFHPEFMRHFAFFKYVREWVTEYRKNSRKSSSKYSVNGTTTTTVDIDNFVGLGEAPVVDEPDVHLVRPREFRAFGEPPNPEELNRILGRRE